MLTALILILIHFIADFIFQTDEMAKGKSTSNTCLTNHVIAYGIVFAVSIIILELWGISLSVMIVPWLLVNLVLHWITDYTTSRINSNNWKLGKVHEFFVGIGADQVVHYACLMGTYYYMIKPF